MALDHAEYLEAAIAKLDGQVDALFSHSTSEAGVPFVEARDRLVTITGVGKRAAECIIAEIGVDMSRFPTAGHLAKWAGVAPGNNITGGKRGSGKTTYGDKWLGEILNQCAWPAARSRDTCLSAQFWRLARRIGRRRPLWPSVTRSWSSAGTCLRTTATTTTSAATTSPPEQPRPPSGPAD
jgi:transposase